MANENVEKVKKELVDQVLGRINQLTQGGFVIPEGYLVENEVRQAYFILTQQRQGEGDYGKPIMEVCSAESVANALFNMAAAGLSAIRNQCYFIPYGNNCTMIRSYFGSEAVARRVAGVVEVDPYTIHEGDKFAHILEGGKIVSVVHEQDFANLDKPIVGAYVFITFQNGKKAVDLMTMAQIRKSWNMSRAKGEKNKLQTQFDVEAAKRTIIQRALKPIINASQDANVYQKDFSTDEESEVVDRTHEVITDRPSIEAKTIALPPAAKLETVPVERQKERVKQPVEKPVEPQQSQEEENDFP